jgi:hypothetical protein
MTFDEILTQVLDLLQRERRLSYRAIKGMGKLNGLFHRPPRPPRAGVGLHTPRRTPWRPPADRSAPQGTDRPGGWGRAAGTVGAARGAP